MGPRKRTAPGDTRRAVAYLRVSTEGQDNGVAAQRAAITAWAKRGGIVIAAWHEDRLSGATPAADRPALLEALQVLRDHGAGLLLVAKRDRIARDVVVAATVEKLVQSAGAIVVSADGVTADATPEGQLMRTLLDAFSQYERAVIRSRTKAALAVLRAKGVRYCHKAPFGSRFEGGALVAHPIEQGQITRVRELRAADHSYAAIARRLNAAGEQCRGGSWHATQVRRILTGER